VNNCKTPIILFSGIFLSGLLLPVILDLLIYSCMSEVSRSEIYMFAESMSFGAYLILFLTALPFLALAIYTGHYVATYNTRKPNINQARLFFLAGTGLVIYGMYIFNFSHFFMDVYSDKIMHSTSGLIFVGLPMYSLPILFVGFFVGWVVEKCMNPVKFVETVRNSIELPEGKKELTPLDKMRYARYGIGGIASGIISIMTAFVAWLYPEAGGDDSIWMIIPVSLGWCSLVATPILGCVPLLRRDRIGGMIFFFIQALWITSLYILFTYVFIQHPELL